MNLRYFALISTMAVPPMLVTSHAEASCGLDHCPIQSSTADEQSEGLSIEIPIKFKTGGFKLPAGQGNFIETIIGIIVAPTPALIVGAEAGWVVLNVNDEHKAGAGNPGAFVQYTVYTSDDFVLSLGSQLEFPMPSSPTAIASSHFEMLPYASARYAHAQFYSTLRAGGRFALEGGSHDDGHSHADHTHLIPGTHDPAVDTTQFVNGHNDSELLVWWDLGREWNDVLNTYAFINGQTSLSDGTEGHTYATVGLSGVLGFLEAFEIHVATEIPITEYKWFDWRSMIEAAVHF